MRDTYSLYEAKARLSAIVRRVREGHNVIVTLHGEPVAEIRPLEKAKGGIEGRVTELIARGVLIPAAGPRARIKPGKPVPGALRRLLDDRNE
jgi:prevent-host-death family protein